MLELLILKRDSNKEIILLQDDSIIEYYKETEQNKRNEGNIFLGIVKNTLPGMDAAFVDIGTEKASYIQKEDLLQKNDKFNENNKNAKVKEQKDFSKIIKVGEPILVQVKKDSNKLKGARISKHLNIPSKYLALMPNTDIITVSQKIEDVEERERLKKLVKENIKAGNGAIIRTSAKGKTKEIIEDLKKVEKVWEEINQKYENLKKQKKVKPQLIYKSQDITQKMLVDLYSKNLVRVITNEKEEIEKIKEFTANQQEYSKIKMEVKSINDIEKLYDIEGQIAKNSKRKIWLKCGGFITIDKTEALTAIDVNSGKLTEGKSFKDIVYKVNEQATIEIAKQIRLRDIGGIIIIDYIDLRGDGDREKIEELLKKCLKEDRAKTQVEGFTKLDLMELTRKHICSHDFGDGDKNHG